MYGKYVRTPEERYQDARRVWRSGLEFWAIFTSSCLSFLGWSTTVVNPILSLVAAVVLAIVFIPAWKGVLKSRPKRTDYGLK